MSIFLELNMSTLPNWLTTFAEIRNCNDPLKTCSAVPSANANLKT